MFLADSEAKATTSNRHTLPTGASHFTISADNWGSLNGMVDLNQVWFDAAVSGEKLVVSYLDVQGELE
jgi:hypothetical protein